MGKEWELLRVGNVWGKRRELMWNGQNFEKIPICFFFFKSYAHIKGGETVGNERGMSYEIFLNSLRPPNSWSTQIFSYCKRVNFHIDIVMLSMYFTKKFAFAFPPCPIHVGLTSSRPNL